MTGFRSSSEISGTSSARRDTRNRTSRSASMSAGARPRCPLSSGKPTNFVQQLVRVVVGQRRDTEPHVPEYFDVNAADAEGDERPEHRIVGDADDGFDAAADHWLNHDAVDRVSADGLRSARDDVGKGLSNVLRRHQVQAHRAELGLVLHLRWTPAWRPPGSQ